MEKAWFTIKQIQPNIYGLAEFQHEEKVISYLIVGKKKALLFDSGMGIGNIKKEVEKITKLPIVLVNSHCHFDHIGGNNQFENIALYDSEFGKKNAKNGSKLLYNNDYIYTQPFSHKSLLKDGEVINIEPFIFKVIHTPGHTPDSICLYEQTTDILLPGDTVYNGPIYLYFEYSSFTDYKSTIAKLAFIKPISKVLPGHNSFTISSNVIKKLKEKIEFLTTPKNNIRVTSKLSLIIKVD